jgi:putative ABC transport system permease protein
MARNMLRNKFRTGMTVLGGAVAVVAFVMLQTLLGSWNAGVDYAAKDRLSTRNKMSFALPLPKRYVDDVAAHIAGVKSATYCDWFGAKWAKAPGEFFANLACADNAFDVYPEISIDPAELAQWKRDKNGAIVGDMLAKKLGMNVGDRVILQGTIYPGDWEFIIDGIYTVPRRSAIDRSTFFFRWEYKNDGVLAPQKNLIGWIFTRVDDPARSAQVSEAIDLLFYDRDVQTSTMSERAANRSLLGAISDVLDAVRMISIIILIIMMLILGNTIAMGVRERTIEFGVLRALGFGPGHIHFLIVGESLMVSLLASLVGLALALPLVQVTGEWLEENMGKFFPAFRISGGTTATALALTLVLGALASVIPAVRAGRMQVTEALRGIT